MQIILTPKFETELEKILEFYFEKSPQVADDFFSGIFNALEFKANSEKSLQLEVSAWQEHKDRLMTIKELLNSYRAKAQNDI